MCFVQILINPEKERQLKCGCITGAGEPFEQVAESLTGQPDRAAQQVTCVER